MIYVASPYSNPDPLIREKRYVATAKYTAGLILGGNAAFSPIVYGHELTARFSVPGDSAFWDSFNRTMFSVCTEMHVLCLPGWTSSIGVAEEVKWAEHQGYHITFVRYFE